MNKKQRRREQLRKAHQRVTQEVHRSGHEVVTGGLAIYMFDHIGHAEGVIPLMVHWVTLIIH